MFLEADILSAGRATSTLHCRRRRGKRVQRGQVFWVGLGDVVKTGPLCEITAMG